MGYHLNRLDVPVFMAVPKPMHTEFGIRYRLESCEKDSKYWPTYIPSDAAAASCLYIELAFICPLKNFLRSFSIFYSVQRCIDNNKPQFNPSSTSWKKPQNILRSLKNIFDCIPLKTKSTLTQP